MHIAVVHNATGPEDRPDEQDVLVQAEAVSKALIELGQDVVQMPCTLDLLSIKDRLLDFDPRLVFNLVESLDGQGRLIHLFPGLLDAMGICYTGSCTESIFVTSHKVLAKERMRLEGLPTPAWIGPSPCDLPFLYKNLPSAEKERWLVKSTWEHGSLGLDDDKPIENTDVETLHQILKERAPKLGGNCFAEVFIEGREFNLSILEGAAGVQVLPPAEIIFEDYGTQKLTIVGYRAKWDSSSYEYHHTPRRFDFPSSDAPLLQHLKNLAVRCWTVFGLKGYARIDFRVDLQGRPWILEINANPCLSPDAGFAAAVNRSGITLARAIESIAMNGFPTRMR
ncbi:MAG: D-alanine--D-alanine ligase [Desulfobacterales bacterium]